MNPIRRNPLALALTTVLAASALAGCSAGSAENASLPTFTSATTAATQTASTLLPDTSVDGQLFLNGGGQQEVLVKYQGDVSSLAARFPGLHAERAIPALNLEVMAVDQGTDVNAAVANLSQTPGVQYAEPNYSVHMIAQTTPPAPATAPNDPMFDQQYAPQIVHAPEAWVRSTGQNVTIAIVDTGIDVTHPDLAAKILPGYAAGDANPTQTPPEKDDNGHGTHCAGIAAALANNGIGIAGIAPDARLLPVKVLSASGSGSYAGVAEGITWAADHGANVISMSLGGSTNSQAVTDAVNHALSRNVVVVAAMGNSGNGKKSYPAAIPGVVAVGATDSNDKIASFSQYGTWISVSAPGVHILSTFPTYQVDLNNEGFPQNYAVLDGTSMATPAVSGLAALVRAAYPGLSQADVKKRIEANADDLGAPGFDIHYGNGRINALRAVS